jgi:hypothetical protein
MYLVIHAEDRIRAYAIALQQSKKENCTCIPLN